MKCSICNTENPPDAKSCQQCGFGLSLGQSAWPDFPTVEIPEPSIDIEWPELSQPETPQAPSIPAWPQDDALAIDVESIELKPATPPPPPALPSQDDQTARSHIARGFTAIRENMYEQAKWEFEQARDLADDPEIIHMALVQLAELKGATMDAAQAQVREPPRQTPPTPAPLSPTPPGPAPPRRSSPPRVIRPIRTTRPAIPTPMRNIDWRAVMRTGLIIGVVNGVLTGCTAPFCIGFLLAPAFGFVAGWSMARAEARATNYGQAPTATSAAVAGGIVGFVGWLGQVIGYPVWLNSLSTVQSDTETLSAILGCITLSSYIPMSAALSGLGWWVGSKKS